MPLSAPGIGSNLDVGTLVDKLMEVERVPLAKLERKEAATQVKISAYGSLRGALSSFSTAVSGLTDPTRFNAARAGIATAGIATASASPNAVAGSYSLEVTNLAKAQRLTSGAFTNTTDVVGTGTITIQFGTYDSGLNSFTGNTAKGTKVLAIDAAHGSLGGIRDAINAANLGVSASIVNDGTGNRLILGSKDTGAANGMRITISGDGDADDTNGAGLSQLAYDPTIALVPPALVAPGRNLQTLIAPEDATMLLDGLLVTKASNTVSDAIEGVTLQLLKTNVGAATTLSVSQDTGAVQAAVETLVKSYNELHKATADLMKSDPAGKQLGALQGDVTLRSIESALRLGLTSAVAGLTGSYTALPQIGLRFERDGTLKLDATKFQVAMTQNTSSVSRLFTATATPSDALVSYLSSTEHTQPGTYELAVSQLATQGATTGSTVAGLLIDATNDTLAVSIDGVSASVTLTRATYASAGALAAEIQSQINGASALSAVGISVSVAQTAGVLSVSSNRYGASSTVALTSGTGLTSLFGSAPTASVGVDAAGTLGGGAAVGSGQHLTGAGGNGAEGLKVQIRGGAIGARGLVQYSQGVAARLDALLDRMLDPKGAISSRTSSLQKSIEAIGRDRERLNEHLEVVQKRYQKQFSSLDQVLTSLNQTSAYLAQQLSALNK